MKDIDTQYGDTADATGLDLQAVHRLKPDEMLVLQYLATNRERIVAEPELAQHVFGDGTRETVTRVSRLLFPVRMAVRRQASLRPLLTHYRGRLAVGIRWCPKQDTSRSVAAQSQPPESEAGSAGQHQDPGGAINPA